MLLQPKWDNKAKFEALIDIFNNQQDRQTAVIITHKHHHNIYLESLRSTAETLLAIIVFSGE